ncbi:D-2-hydroxyacid dehydrogenase [Paenibacillus sp. ACRRX]|uniref:D-2-hydroxyacid dehydrogenase n=1 Tax=Paenibacillus sp. ACRRX TaxID=2918206 RepID=UPI001EF4CD41|nr:D-2-hydroxyacid dehydrogenase [Paenibacillus sp. ACRRX]MCG7409073.1 D-2-hydroxyacid dehydrogenase [Paenibacillus sp. ACRRX]
MNIVILDGYTLNPGDLSWEKIRSAAAAGGLPLNEVRMDVYERTALDQIVERASEADIILTNKTRLGRTEFAQLPKLQYIGVLATGYDVVDVHAAGQQGIVVTNVPSYGTDAVAQYVMALLLSWCHRIERHDDAVKRGRWSRQPDFSFWLSPQVELAGKTFGIIGFGRIGQQVSRLAHAFGMHVLVATRRSPDVMLFPHVEAVSQEELLYRSDFVSLHCPLTADTRKMVDQHFIAQMKSSAVLINTARGALVNEADLAHALQQGLLAAALLDVLTEEPPAEGQLLLQQEKAVITPHMAWAAQDARRRLLQIAADNIQAYLAGSPINTVG